MRLAAGTDAASLVVVAHIVLYIVLFIDHVIKACNYKQKIDNIGKYKQRYRNYITQ